MWLKDIENVPGLGLAFLFSLAVVGFSGILLAMNFETASYSYVIVNVILEAVYFFVLLSLLSFSLSSAIVISVIVAVAACLCHFCCGCTDYIERVFNKKADVLDLMGLAISAVGLFSVFHIWLNRYPQNRAHLLSWLGWTWFILFDWFASYKLIDGWWWLPHIGIGIAALLWIYACVLGKRGSQHSTQIHF